MASVRVETNAVFAAEWRTAGAGDRDDDAFGGGCACGSHEVPAATCRFRLKTDLLVPSGSRPTTGQNSVAVDSWIWTVPVGSSDLFCHKAIAFE
jgi:hypothetical protein